MCGRAFDETSGHEGVEAVESGWHGGVDSVQWDMYWERWTALSSVSLDFGAVEVLEVQRRSTAATTPSSSANTSSLGPNLQYGYLQTHFTGTLGYSI